MERKAEIKRKTNETDIFMRIILGSTDKSKIETGVPFFNHMLELMAKHGRFFIELQCNGDNIIDDHHTIEDAGICFGKSFQKALGSKAGIQRFGSSLMPMDDALTMVAVDLSGRPFFQITGLDNKGYINKYSEELTVEFLRAFANNAELNLHVKILDGENRHHIHESIFKAVGVSLMKACTIDKMIGGEIPSTKGTLL